MSNPPNTLDISAHLPALFFSLSNKLAQHAHHNSARALKMDMCEWRVIQILGRDGACSINQVADRITMDRGGTSRAISRLEARGYIARTADPKDRRRSTVTLTEKGVALNVKIVAFGDARQDQLKSCLTPEESQALVDMLERLHDQADLMLKEGQHGPRG